MPDKILVFVPAYNCAPQIGRVLAQFDATIGARFDEVLVLDNGSKDGTPDAAIAAAAAAKVRRVTVARNQDNYGLGGSHKSAYAYAAREGFTHVVTLHGDDQGDIRELAPVLSADDHNRFDACLGARFAPGSQLKGYSKFRIFGNHVFNAVFTAAARRRVLDMGSGLNILARAAYADPAVTRHSDDLRFNIYLFLTLFDQKRKVMFFPITWREDDQVSNVKMASQAVKTLAIAGEYSFKRKRFRSSDHRLRAHERYAFDVIAQFENGERRG